MGWFFILGEIFTGEAGKVAATNVPESVKAAFSAMRFIVSVGWSIYPLGYFFGYLCGAVDPADRDDKAHGAECGLHRLGDVSGCPLASLTGEDLAQNEEPAHHSYNEAHLGVAPLLLA